MSKQKKKKANAVPDLDFHIPAGTFRELCSTTRDTLRYYRTQGILMPRVNPANGYSYYSHAQIGSFYLIRSLQSMGCSISDIREYLLSGDQEVFDSYVERQYEAMLEERRQLDLRISSLHNTISILKLARSIDGKGVQFLRLAHTPHVVSTPVSAQNATSLKGISPDLNTHLENFESNMMQAFPIGIVIDRAQFLQGEYRYRQIFSAQDCLLEPDDKGPVVIAALVGKDADGPIEAKYRELAAALRECGRQPDAILGGAVQEDETQADANERTIQKRNQQAAAITGNTPQECEAQLSQNADKHSKQKKEDESATPLDDIYCLSIVNTIDPSQDRTYLKLLFTVVE